MVEKLKNKELTKINVYCEVGRHEWLDTITMNEFLDDLSKKGQQLVRNCSKHKINNYEYNK